MERCEDVKKFSKLLSHATSNVGEKYFMLPVADTEDGEPIYRERVYAYELYHQLRSVWPEWPYTLGGEVDKKGHPIIHGHGLDNVKPDLLVHVPRTMDGNLVVVEIKAASQNSLTYGAIEKDLKKLAAFCDRPNYSQGILLVFGTEIDRIREHAATATKNGVSLDNLNLWHHREAGAKACQVKWHA